MGGESYSSPFCSLTAEDILAGKRVVKFVFSRFTGDFLAEIRITGVVSFIQNNSLAGRQR